MWRRKTVPLRAQQGACRRGGATELTGQTAPKRILHLPSRCSRRYVARVASPRYPGRRTVRRRCAGKPQEREIKFRIGSSSRRSIPLYNPNFELRACASTRKYRRSLWELSLLSGRRTQTDWGAVPFSEGIGGRVRVRRRGDFRRRCGCVRPAISLPGAGDESEWDVKRSEEQRKTIFRADNPNLSSTYDEALIGEQRGDIPNCRNGSGKLRISASARSSGSPARGDGPELAIENCSKSWRKRIGHK